MAEVGRAKLRGTDPMMDDVTLAKAHVSRLIRLDPCMLSAETG